MGTRTTIRSCHPRFSICITASCLCSLSIRQVVNQSAGNSASLIACFDPFIVKQSIMAIGVESKTAVGNSRPPLERKRDRFDTLVLALKEALGPSSGLCSDDVDVDFLTRLMEDYDGTDGEWARYAFGDGSRGYTRNLVDEGNGKSNLVRPRWARARISMKHHGSYPAARPRLESWQG